MSLPFIDALESWGDRPAFVFAGRSALTYWELAERISRHARDFGKGRKLIGIEAGTCEHAIVSYLAALKAGHAVALLPPFEPALADQFRRDFAPDIICRFVDGRWRRDENREASATPMHPDLALLLSTSGSTGISKSVRLSANAIASNAAAIAYYLDLRAEDRGALVLPLHYSYGLSVLNAHLTVGASLFIPGGSILDAEFAADLARQGVTNLPGVPFSFELFERIGLRDSELPALRFMTVAGGRLEPTLVSRYRDFLERRGGRFFVMYGQTEATARIAYVPPQKLAGHEDCIGIAVPGGRLSLVDDSGREIEGTDGVGELTYAGPNVMMGYATGRDDLALGHIVESLRTGDLAERTSDGLFRIVGRLSRISKIAGLRIAHDALEQALGREGIEAVVTGDDHRVTAFFRGGQTEADIRKCLAALSGLTLLHVEARRLAQFPRLSNGKIDHQALLRFAPTAKPPVPGVRDTFRRAFFPTSVRDTDTFQLLGGDSLRFVELSLSLERHLGSLPQGWETRSIADLAALAPERSTFRRVGIEIPLRSIAILLVVVYHEMLWPIAGGSALMLALVGFSLARFQTDAFVRRDWHALMRPLAYVLLPYALIVAGYSLAWETIPWASVFLIGNFGFADPVHHNMLPYLYWFVELYAQALLLFVGLSFLPKAREAVERAPFHAGLAFLAVALALRFVVPPFLDMGNRQNFTLYWNLQIVAFGWCAHHATTHRRKRLLTVLAVAVFGYLGFFNAVWIGTTIKYAIVLVGVLALTFIETVSLPRTIAGWIVPIAAASYHIYLFHRRRRC
ncbi:MULTISPECIES: AMP-binding protein [unclassified Sinorhizobium]|uniref:AMP-binding protein n=1 Tax=unclassified Sinorhizobium TaxID=2613772 RepID=UPI0035262B12